MERPTSKDGNPERSVGAAAITCSASTTIAWEWRKVRRPAGGHTDRQPKAGRWWSLPPWPRRRPLTLTVTSRGGAEAWVEIHSRGRSGRYPGHTAIIDVLNDIWR